MRRSYAVGHLRRRPVIRAEGESAYVWAAAGEMVGARKRHDRGGAAPRPEHHPAALPSRGWRRAPIGQTKTQAEARLREEMTATVKAPPPVTQRMSIEEVGSRLIKQLRAKHRKDSTLENYQSYLSVHLVPHFGETPITDITVDDVEDFIEVCLEDHAIKSTLNYLGLLHGIFDFAIRKRWAHENPCKLVEKPDPEDTDKDIRYLDQAELDALVDAAGVRYRHGLKTLERAARVRSLRNVEKLPWKKIAAALGTAESTAIYLYRCEPDAMSVSDADLRRVERVLYLTAAMTGLRQLAPVRDLTVAIELHEDHVLLNVRSPRLHPCRGRVNWRRAAPGSRRQRSALAQRPDVLDVRAVRSARRCSPMFAGRWGVRRGCGLRRTPSADDRGGRCSMGL